MRRWLAGSVCAALLTAAATGQQPQPRDRPVVRQIRSERTDNAAPLYRLALAELRRVMTAQDAIVLRGHLGVEGTSAATPTPFGDWAATEEWQRFEAEAAPALELFRLAASREACEWSRDAEGQVSAQRTQQLFWLAALTARDGLVACEEDPARALRCAEALVSRARHVAADHPGTPSAGRIRALVLRQDALRIVATMLERRRAGEARSLVDRCQQVLDALRATEVRRAPTQLLTDELDAVLDAHAARLRDVHQTEPDGYDRVRFRGTVVEMLGAELFETTDAERWQRLLRTRAEANSGRAPANSTTTERVARGVVHLVCIGVERRRDRQQQLEAHVEKVEAALDALRAK